MKIFTNKNLIQKVIIAFVLVMSLNFCLAPSVHASFGGKLMGYIVDFATALSDVAISVIQFGLTGEWTYAVDKKGTAVTDDSVDYWIKDSKFQYPVIQVSPELIFSGQIEILDIDFIGDTSEKQYALDSDGNAIHQLRIIIASWYVTLRTIAIVGLLSVLIYIGIKIIISSTSQDRAKYKQRLVDWIVAFCLLFFMHYIMAVAVNVIERVNNMLDGASSIESGISIPDEYGYVKYNPTQIVDTSTGETMTDSEAGTALMQQQIDNIVPIATSKGRVRYGDTYFSLDQAVNNGYMMYPEVTSSGTQHTYRYTPSPDFVASGLMDDGYIQTTYDTVTLNGIGSAGGTVYVTGGRATSSSSESYDVSEINSYLSTLSPYVEDDMGIDINQGAGQATINGNRAEVTTEEGKKVTVSADAVNSGKEVLYYINYVRLFLNAVDSDEYMPMQVGYLIIYIVLVVLTGMFAIRYMKRVIYVAFLTLMAPLVALTYPIDKIKDRKSASL